MKKRLLIGVIITDCHVDFQEEILRGIISQAFKSNCDVAVIAPLHNFYADSEHKQSEKNIFRLVMSSKFDGFLYDRNTFFGDTIRNYIDSLLASTGKPVMLLDSGDHRSFESTSIDDSVAFEELTDHLINVHGKKKIYCITGPKEYYSSKERLNGYKNSMKKNGLYFDKSYCFYGDFWKNIAQDIARKIVSGQIDRPEAVVCGNDIMAIALSSELIAGGINVPGDIAVVGYDASEDGYSASPSITSYSRPNFQLGAEAFRRLYRIITGKICSRVPNENGSIRIGESCGCCEDPKLRKTIQRKVKINQRFQTNWMFSDMLFDITNVDNFSDFADRLDNYTYFIYKMRRMNIILTRSFINSANGSFTDKLPFRFGDDVMPILSKSAIRRQPGEQLFFSSNDLLPEFSSDKPYPSAFYITPLHYNSNFFGYAAISFGKDPVSFSSLYLQWINYVNVALETVRYKAIMNKKISETARVMLYDDVTGLLNRNGFEQKVAELANSAGSSSAECIRIQLPNITKTYYQSGEEKCRRIVSAFADKLLSCLEPEEICCSWAFNTFAVITMDKKRTDELFDQLSAAISSCSGEESCNIDFHIGTCTIISLISTDLSDIMHKAAVNRVCSYTISDQHTNPQFEKLCQLRNQIMKNPEAAWNISEIAEKMYLSKSYLQKIYKTYFGKSIIEEMIEFRIEKAKDLLTNTELTVTDIARECGYSSYNYFVRQFKAVEGISPSAYRTEKSPDTTA